MSLGGVLLARPAQPPPVFRAGINVVEVDALVFDRQGAFVSDLRPDAFEVLEDGKPQKITSFQLVNIPIPAAGEHPVPRPAGDDVERNWQEPGRLLVLVFDDLHVTPLRIARVKALGAQFVDRVGPNDMMAILCTSGRQEGAEGFTSDHEKLNAAVSRFEASRDVVGGSPSPSVKVFEAIKAQAMLNTLAAAAKNLAPVRHRRKTVVFISEGVDLDLLPGPEDPRNIITSMVTSHDVATATGTPEDKATQVREALTDMMRAAQRADVAIYPIDPRGLIGDGEEDAAPVNANAFLRTIAGNTGGVAIVASNGLAEGLDRIIHESSTYYLLGFESMNDKADGKFHTLTVRVKRAGLEVRARSGYVAPDAKRLAKGKTPSTFDDALAAPVPIGGVAIRATAAAVPARSKTGAAIAVAAEISAGQAASGIEYAVLAVDHNGKGQAIDRETLRLTSGTRPTSGESWIRIVSRLDVKPGLYQVRVVAQATGSESIGSVFSDVDVPEFAQLPLSMSGILLGPLSDGALNPKLARVQEVSPVIPLATRSFSRTDRIWAFAAIHTSNSAADQGVETTSAIFTAPGRQVFNETHVEKAATAKHGVERVIALPLTTLAPGDYLLRFTAASLAAGVAPVSRQLRFSVR